MINLIKYIFSTALFILLFSSSALTQNKFNSDELIEDLSILGELTIELSPKLTKNDQIRIEQLIESKKKELSGKSFTSIGFFNFLAEMDLRTKFDEHASLSITEEVITPFLAKSKLFPIPIKIIGSRIVVNAADLDIPFGSVIHAINGIELDTLMRSFTRGYDDTFVKRRMERQFSILYLIKKGSFENFQIEYTESLDPQQKLQKTIEGIDFDTYITIFNETVYPLDQAKLENLINTDFYEEAQTYYLQLNSFNWDIESGQGFLSALKADHKNFDKRFKNIFKEVAESKAENLVIDLRFNTGGDVKTPGVLFSYIAEEAFTEDIIISIPDFNIPYLELVRQISDADINHPKKVDKFIKRYKKVFTTKTDTNYVWELAKNKQRKPSKIAFKGNVYLLVGGLSISASSYFTALFKSNKRGVIIGEEMGGSYRSLSAGQILTYQLPNTKLELEAPIMEVNFSDQLYQHIKIDRIIPDLQFDEEERYDYFLSQKDIELKKSLELIKSENK